MTRLTGYVLDETGEYFCPQCVGGIVAPSIVSPVHADTETDSPVYCAACLNEIETLVTIDDDGRATGKAGTP